jgi:2-polyprenyl-6-methoxyphenol hydroxylase-like FAD-dependent oxidoreductase
VAKDAACQRSPLSIAIAGFGIGGGAAAVLLARDGHRVTMLERATTLGPVGAGFLLQPSGQGVLDRMQLLTPLASSSEPISGLRAITHRGTSLIDLGFSSLGPGVHALGIARRSVFELLRSSAEQLGVVVALGFELETWREQDHSVFARSIEGEERGPFDLLLVANGARSTLRRQVDATVRETDDPYAALWALGPCHTVRGHLLQVTKGTRQLTGLLPLGSGRANFFWGLAARDWEPLRRSPFANFRDAVLTLNPLAEEVFDEAASFESFTYAAYRHALPRRVVAGRVALLGDAAHATTPHLGQGANLALLDAECLAQSIAQAATVPAALDRYQRERRAQNRYYVELSRWLSPFFQSDRDSLGPVRDLGLPLLARLPPVRRTMERSLAGMKGGWVS